MRGRGPRRRRPGQLTPPSRLPGRRPWNSLERANLFILPLDNERRWYRYHHLFAELLRHRLAQTSPALAPKLHRLASVWLESENLIEEAVAHAFASRDWEHTANLIYHFADRVHTQTNLTTLGGWLAALPEPVMRARPWLCVYQALAWYWTGPRDRIEEHLQLAEQALPGSQMPEAEATHLAGYIAALRAHYALVSGNIPRVLAMAQVALQQLPAGDYMRGWTAVALGGAYWGQGNVIAAQQAFETAKTVALQHNYRLRAVAPACYVGMQLVKQGKLDEALCVYREGVAYATVAGGQQLPIAGFPKVKLGDVLRERNDLPGADQWLRPGVEQCLQLGHPDVLADAYAALARLQLAQNDWPGAYASFQKADELAQKSPVDPFVRCWLDDCRVRLWLAKGRLDDLTAVGRSQRADRGRRTQLPLRSASSQPCALAVGPRQARRHACRGARLPEPGLRPAGPAAPCGRGSGLGARDHQKPGAPGAGLCRIK